MIYLIAEVINCNIMMQIIIIYYVQIWWKSICDVGPLAADTICMSSCVPTRYVGLLAAPTRYVCPPAAPTRYVGPPAAPTRYALAHKLLTTFVIVGNFVI